ncbi:MAG: FtsQ-type POTRA domain-containing protein [Candidatus Wallbacteria bacterium]|nr:FtsQ-type POTRA domain-containing protein [Candidatus Wallbacteria bacterium]
MEKVLRFKPAAHKKNQKKWQRIFKNLFRLAFLSLLVVIICFELYFLVTSTSYFELRKIRVDGNQHLESNSILKFAGVYPGMKMFKLARAKVASQVEELVWVKSAHARFESFGELVITVVERKPESILFCNNFFYEVDKDGIVLVKGIRNIDETLPIITGIRLDSEHYEGELISDSNFQMALDWINNLKDFMIEEISEINVESDLKIYFFTLNGVKIYPGRFDKFRSVYPVVRKELDLASKGKTNIDYIDMRYDNEIIYKTLTKLTQ